MEVFRDGGELEVATVYCECDVVFWERDPLDVCSSEVRGAGEGG